VGFVKTFGAVFLTSVLVVVLTGPGLKGQRAQPSDGKAHGLVATLKVNRSGERRASLRMNGASGPIATNVARGAHCRFLSNAAVQDRGRS